MRTACVLCVCVCVCLVCMCFVYARASVFCMACVRAGRLFCWWKHKKKKESTFHASVLDAADTHVLVSLCQRAAAGACNVRHCFLCVTISVIVAALTRLAGLVAGMPSPSK